MADYGAVFLLFLLVKRTIPDSNKIPKAMVAGNHHSDHVAGVGWVGSLAAVLTVSSSIAV